MKDTFIGIPSGDGTVRGELIPSVLDASQSHKVCVCFHKYSKLTGNFNELLTTAINRKVHTHFLLLHADIVPQAGWLTAMHEEMEQTGADVISAVSPIKTPRGITSTGLCKEETTPLLIRRLTLKECLDPAKLKNLGLSLSPSGRSFTGDYLILNTGLMLIDLRKDWVRKICFRVTDYITEQPDGSLKTHGGTEDWLFSLDARKLGAKLWATNAAKLHHVGGSNFSNFEPYGIEEEGWRES